MIKPNKELGQHWLYDSPSLEAMAQSAAVKNGDNVLEIGPGLGSLTQVLINAGAKVTAVEFDSALAAKLKDRVNHSRQLDVIEYDILKFDFNKLPVGYKIVANIPYYLTSALIRTICEAKNPPSTTVLLVQKEVAERVCASPGQMSLLSVSAQMYYKCLPGMVVRAELFDPPPKVDSQILILNRLSVPLFKSIDQTHFFRVVKAGFSERRKKLRSSLSGGLNISKDQADELLQKAGIDPNLRAQNLSIKQWLTLAKSFK